MSTLPERGYVPDFINLSKSKFLELKNDNYIYAFLEASGQALLLAANSNIKIGVIITINRSKIVA